MGGSARRWRQREASHACTAVGTAARHPISPLSPSRVHHEQELRKIKQTRATFGARHNWHAIMQRVATLTLPLGVLPRFYVNARPCVLAGFAMAFTMMVGDDDGRSLTSLCRAEPTSQSAWACACSVLVEVPTALARYRRRFAPSDSSVCTYASVPRASSPIVQLTTPIFRQSTKSSSHLPVDPPRPRVPCASVLGLTQIPIAIAATRLKRPPMAVVVILDVRTACAVQ
ncbi:hypothetical protein C8Q70DRAFT_151171 [Cubamyces menziesii]|nr:hypothetical protein C8Q70DRAFT_151171 [Cubamyces menziesii]